MDISIIIEQRRSEIEKEARSDALAEEPKQDAADLMHTETILIEEAKEKGRGEIKRIGYGLEDVRNTISEVERTLEDARGQRGKIEKSSPPTPRNLEDLERDVKRAEADYNHFKESNKISREATGDDRVAQLMWALTVIGVESLFNSYFYAPISEYGFLGGAFTAFFVSLANVSFAFIGGVLGLRYLSHIDSPKRLIGMVTSLACLFVCLLVIAFSALYRGHVDTLRAQSLDIVELTLKAWHAALISVQNLDFWALVSSLESFLLVLVGLLCAIIGFWKGWAYDDPYPGFGAVHRRREKAREAFQRALEENEMRQENWHRHQKADLKQAYDDLSRAAEKMRSTLAGIREEIQGGNQLAGQTKELVKVLLGIYRDKNKEVRSYPPPLYFNEFPNQKEFQWLDDEINQLSNEIKQLEEKSNKLYGACTEELTKIRNATNHPSYAYS